jgi:hypothetical protein
MADLLRLIAVVEELESRKEIEQWVSKADRSFWNVPGANIYMVATNSSRYSI